MGFRARYEFLDSLACFVNYNRELPKLDLLIYQKLQDEVERLKNYRSLAQEVLNLIKRKEQVKVDKKNRLLLGSQLQIKIEEYRRAVKRKQNTRGKVSGRQPPLVDDIFWGGVAYIDVCKAEKEAEEREEKEIIKD